MGKINLEKAMRARTSILSMRCSSSNLEMLVGKVLLNHPTTLTTYFPGSQHFTYCQIAEIFLGVEREPYGTNFHVVYFQQLRAGLIQYRFNRLSESDFVSMDFESGRYRGVLAPFERSDNIYTFSYTKEHLEKKVDLTLFYLEELGFRWIESFHDNILSFTLVKNW